MIYHLSSSRRFNKDGSPNNAGGVELFGWYLNKAIGCEIVTPEDNIQPHAGDIIIADGYYASGWDTNTLKIISVIHGSWLEFAIRNNKLNDFIGEAQKQHVTWVNPAIKKVAVSEASAYYLLKHDGVMADKVILNAVNTELFVPIEHHNKKPVVIYASNSYNKDGQGRLGKIAEILKDDFEFRYLNANIGESHIKFAQGDIFIQGSFYEGNSYAAIEAMSCGLPVVASRAGLFENTVFNDLVGEIVDWNAPAEDFAKAIRFLWSKKSAYNPRKWVKENADFNYFKMQWEDYIRSI